MNADRKHAIESVLEIIREDIKADVTRRERLPFTGATVGQALGEICGQIDALAHVMQELVGEVVPS